MDDLTTEILPADAFGYARASEIWGQGGLVSFPTETVYGLGADARNDNAVAGIYLAKGRPSFNPLIVHVHSIEAARRYVEWSSESEQLASAFWPGPLTLVLPVKSDTEISSLVTAGLETLAIRVPAHPVAGALLRRFDGPVAAPSANPSGKISPTMAAHVVDGLGGRIDAVIEGGACGVGLESTILGLSETPTLLRPGGLPQEAIEQMLGHRLAERSTHEAISAPGQLLSHYAPGAHVRLNAKTAHEGEVMLGFGPIDGTRNLSKAGDLREAAANLFKYLHELDTMGAQGIAVAPIPRHGLGRAINDRLRRAAAPRH